MAMSLNELTQKLNQETYVPRTDEQLKSEAENRYASIYGQKKLTAQQNYDASDLAYQKQLQSLTDTLALNQQALQRETANSIANANRYQVTRGMQRSSYGAANNARLEAAGDANLAQLLRQYGTDAGNIESNRTLLARQLADTLAQYDIDYLNDINAYIDEQKQIDYDREQAALQNQNQILMALYEYGKAAGGGGGGGRRSYSSGGGQTPPPADNSNTGDDIIGILNAYSTGNPNASKIQTMLGVNPTFGKVSQTTSSNQLIKPSQTKNAKQTK